MISIDIPIMDKKNPPTLVFGTRCVNCGKPNETMLGISLQMDAQKRGQPVIMKLDVPMCTACADKERGIAKVTLVPFLIGGFLVGLLVFIPVVLIAPDGTSTQTLSMPWVIGGIAGLIAGLIGGSLVEFLVKILAAPFYGRLVTRRPLTLFALLTESDQLLGLAAKFSRESNMVQLIFENEDVAREFKKLNPTERS
jgi:hypothetical protein